MSADHNAARRKRDGVRVVPGGRLDAAAAQAPEGVVGVGPRHPAPPNT